MIEGGYAIGPRYFTRVACTEDEKPFLSMISDLA